jgi:oligosaccharyltransferase complex subunit delta (ribophorin II)
VGSQAKSTLEGAIVEGAATRIIFQAVAALANLGLPIDDKKVSSALLATLKVEDSPLSHGYAFYAASYLKGDLKTFFDLIEDVIAQADEIDEKFLQFESGLYTTAVVIDSSYKLAAAYKKEPTVLADKVTQFANYMLNRKHMDSLKNAATILSAIKTLTQNKFHVPIAVTLASQVSVSSQYPTVQVRVSDLLGGSLGKVTVTADTARHIGDDAIVMSKKPFKASSLDSALYELDFLEAKPACGFYAITVSVSPQTKDSRLIGTSGAEVRVKVTTKVSIENVELGVADKDQSTAPRMTRLQPPNKVTRVLEADHLQRIIMKFQLRNMATSSLMTAHQTFVRLTNKKTRREIIFVAEVDSSSSTYTFDLDVGGREKEFGYLSGEYMMELIIGDAVIQNPLSWIVADVNLKFSDSQQPSTSRLDSYKAKPEIKHLFRVADKRPSTFISNVFTVMVLLPFLLLLIMWIKIGVNVSNFPFSLSAIGFHGGVAAIFGLYYLYWVQLNMFETLRYLGFIGIPTFLFGNRLLSSIAAKRK